MPQKDHAPQSSWINYALAAGAPVALYLLWSGRAFDWFSQPVRETDFDSFLVKQGDHPTGLTPNAKRKSKSSQRGKVSGPFETFLKVDANEEEEDHRNPLDFNSFLKSARQTTTPLPGPAAAPVDAKPEPAGPQPHQARVLVMYGTEYGFSREIAEKLCTRLLGEGPYWPVLIDMGEYPEGYDLSKEQAVLVACSTQGDGVPPTEARGFCEWLFAGKAGNLAHLSFAVCALGDKTYTHFCRCGKLVDAAFESAGAKRVHERVDVNKEDWAAVDQWTEGVVSALATLTLKPVGDAAVAAGDAKANGHLAPTTKRWGKSRPYSGRVLALEGLCTVTSQDDKNTFRVEFDLGDSGMTYVPGDALGIYPTNATQYVDELLSVLGADPSLTVPTPSWHYEPSSGSKSTTISLKEALTVCYDIKSPKADLFQVLWQSLPEASRLHHPVVQGVSKVNAPAPLTNGNHVEGAEAHVTLANGNGIKTTEADVQAKALAALINGGSTAQESYLTVGRHVVDVLREFNEAKVTPTQLLSTLRQLQPRLYSISSAPLEHPQHVQATIAEVKYQALGTNRIGVCSTYVSERIQVSHEVPVYIHKNPDFRLPPSSETPIIMVGPGTGLAPFRSFILERLLQAGRLNGTGSGPAPVEMVLFFGCRRSDQDYLYGQDLEAWAKAGHITLHTAFSRQQANKVYVQDRLREQAASVWRLLDQQGGHFYVCGDASSMAGAVEAELLRIIARKGLAEGEVGEDALAAAQQYLDGLSKTGRYQRDVWY